MSIHDQLVLIRNYDLWSRITEQELDELNLVHHFAGAKRGEYIYFDSHLHGKLYFIKEGNVKIGYFDEEGNEIVKEIIRQGEVFGQFTLERDNLNGEFAQAYKADVSLCAFTIEDFEKILQQKPDMAIRYSRQVGRKLRNAEFRLVNMLRKDVHSRLLGFFYQLALNNGYREGESGFRMDNFLTHEDIARLIGSARQTVTSSLRQLEREGLVLFNRREIRMPDLEKLKKTVIVT